MDRVGLCGGPVRPPVRPAGPELDPLIDSIVAALTGEGFWPEALQPQT